MGSHLNTKQYLSEYIGIELSKGPDEERREGLLEGPEASCRQGLRSQSLAEFWSVPSFEENVSPQKYDDDQGLGRKSYVFNRETGHRAALQVHAHRCQRLPCAKRNKPKRM